MIELALVSGRPLAELRELDDEELATMLDLLGDRVDAG